MTKLEELEQFDYHKHNSVYISDYIKFADTKAGVAISVAGVLLAYSFVTLEKKVDGQSICHILSDWTFYPQLLSILSFITGLIFLLLTIWPRYLVDKTIYHSWGGIGGFSTPAEYVDFLDSKLLDATGFLHDLAVQNHALAKVCVQKYTHLKPGFFWLVLGTVLGGVGWFFG